MKFYEAITEISQRIPSHIPAELVYVSIATTGGVARYLSNYAQSGNFRLSVFCASAFASGFSGWMFALLGGSLQMAPQVIYIMAGVGGFFGDQTMKFILEYVQNKKLN